MTADTLYVEGSPALKKAKLSGPTGAMHDSMKPGLGDIMGSATVEPPVDLPSLDTFSPLQRTVLFANGNLQRILSSYHDSPVTVTVRFNRRKAHGSYEREVDLSVFGCIFAVCTSSVVLTTEECIRAIEVDGVGIGQLFRHLNIMPAFSLLQAGQLAAAAEESPTTSGPQALDSEARFWREYQLSGLGVQCTIREVLRSDLFELRPAISTEASQSSAVAQSSGFGDLMSGTVTSMLLPSGFSPKQRILITANGNVERLLSSYYNSPVTTCVMLNNRRSESDVYDRQIAMLVDGRQLMLAKSTIFLTDPAWQKICEDENVPVGSMFHRMGVLPTFTLHHAGVGPQYFWRVYQLKSSGMTCEINETFSIDVFTDADSRPEKPQLEGHGF
ncbi:unnamed protein product [Polarella glacialis]|uniref:Uncharacterized protein n=1 Tax=Polarella glacialis TaxID=89957 RepID=A0A813DD16_POLGL|nr:unnamed protein product [Polarella glacialis]|mmetsp:Transcript_44939/g.72966  ORF Transcript_44939/g.72966 Transcript_44939/m.72966 type:complete len:387 (-) Transcript_44939:2-1162(-)